MSRVEFGLSVWGMWLATALALFAMGVVGSMAISLVGIGAATAVCGYFTLAQ